MGLAMNFFDDDEMIALDEQEISVGVEQKRTVRNHVQVFKTITKKHVERGDKRYQAGRKHLPSYIGKDVNYALIASSQGQKMYHNDHSFIERIVNKDYKERFHVPCSSIKGYFRTRELDTALNYPYLRVNPLEVCYYLIVDVDSTTFPELMKRFKEVGVYPHIAVGSDKKNNSWHLYFGLQFSEFQDNHMVRRVRQLLNVLFYGDVNYTNHFARNPLCASFSENSFYFDLPNYEIEDLQERLYKGLKCLPRMEQHVIKQCLAQGNVYNEYVNFIFENTSGSRNVDTFFLFSRMGRVWLSDNSGDKRTTSNRIEALVRYLSNTIAKRFENIIRDLPSKEVRDTAKSVARYLIERQMGAVRYQKKGTDDKTQERLRYMNLIDDLVIRIRKDEEVVKMLPKQMRGDSYLRLAKRFNVESENPEQLMRDAVRVARGILGISLGKRKHQFITDTVKAVKEARYQANEEENRVHFERVEINAVKKQIIKEGRKQRAIMKANGATEAQLKQHAEDCNRRAQEAADSLTHKYTLANSVEALREMVNCDDKYNPEIAKGVSALHPDLRILATLQQMAAVVEVDKARKFYEKEIEANRKKTRQKKFFLSNDSKIGQKLAEIDKALQV